MPNAIKYSTSAQTLALKKGNYWIGTGDVSKGPTSSTDYWNGITPPSGGYTIYVNKASQGPSIKVAANDSQLIAFTNEIANASYTTVNQCFNYFAGQSDKMCFNRDYEAVITNGLIVNLDGGFLPSYPRNNNSWYDISGNDNHFTLYNGAVSTASNGGGVEFDGTNDYARSTNTINLSSLSAVTVQIACYTQNTGMIYESSGDWNVYEGAFGLALNADGYNVNNNVAHFYWKTNLGPSGGARNFYSNVYQTFFVETKILIKNNSDGLQDYYNGSRVTYTNDPPANQWGTSTSTIGSTTNFLNDYIYLASRNGASSFINGRICSFLIYNRALTATEVLQNYNTLKTRFGL